MRLVVSAAVLETPPLTRRKLLSLCLILFIFRNTSAYAEKTRRHRLRTRNAEKHLRLRGENVLLKLRKLIHTETPPLTRRKQPFLLCGWLVRRNTSAYAEKTYFSYLGFGLL